MTRHCIGSALGALVLACVSSAVMAQFDSFSDVAKKLPFGSDRPASAVGPGSAKAAGDGLVPAKPNAGVEDKLAPDTLCRRFEETSDVWGALAEYGGLQAQTRAQQILSSDFRFADLTPEDKKMLRYISYTTVWVPSSVELGFGKLYLAATSRSRDTGGDDRSEAAQLNRVETQLQEFRSHITDFPGSSDLVVDKNLRTGAYSQVGGLIVLSSDFLNRMDEKEPVKQLILAHELSHLYKRHTVKELQYQLITSASGFDLGKKLLGRSNPARSNNPIQMAKDAFTLATAGRELYQYVREHQVAFSLDQEFEADTCSVQLMKRSGLDPKPLVSALAELEAVQKDDDAGYGKTHPSNRERQDKLLAAIGGKPRSTATANPVSRAPKVVKKKP